MYNCTTNIMRDYICKKSNNNCIYKFNVVSTECSKLMKLLIESCTGLWYNMVHCMCVDEQENYKTIKIVHN